MKKIRQWDAKDCGVTCLSYLIQYYGGFVPMEKLREDTFTTHNGTNAYFLVQTLKKYGLKHISFHGLRHSCGSLLNEQGFTLKDIQEWLGHSDIQTTANIYLHLDTKRKENIAKSISSILI